MTNFHDVRKGDELWMVNGRQTSAFEANVVEVDERTITVAVPEKDDALFTFLREDGTAATDPETSQSFLVADDDWRIKVILDRKDHAAHHTRALEALSQFRRNPNEKARTRLEQTIREWMEFTEDADHFALTTETMADYALALTGNAPWR